MAHIQQSLTINAPVADVWAVLADYPNISNWNSGVKTSFATSDATSGVGAQRHCDLAPFGTLEETIATWDEGSQLTINIDSATKVPIKSGVADFSLSAVGEATSISVDYTYVPKFGPVGKLMAPLLNRSLNKGFQGFLADLDTAATT